MTKVGIDTPATLSEAAPMVSEDIKLDFAAAALYFGTGLAYISGVLLMAYMVGSFHLGFYIGVAAAGLHIVLLSLLKTTLNAGDSYLRFAIGLFFLDCGAWAIYVDMTRGENTPAALSGVFILCVGSAVAGWRYRWLHPRR